MSSSYPRTAVSRLITKVGERRLDQCPVNTRHHKRTKGRPCPDLLLNLALGIKSGAGTPHGRTACRSDYQGHRQFSRHKPPPATTATRVRRTRRRRSMAADPEFNAAPTKSCREANRCHNGRTNPCERSFHVHERTVRTAGGPPISTLPGGTDKNGALARRADRDGYSASFFASSAASGVVVPSITCHGASQLSAARSS
jgi:hypothetical protein